MRVLIPFAAAAFACQPVVAQAQDAACLSPKQAASLASYALPSVISGTTKRCATTLPGNSFLKTSGETLAKRYATRKTENWPAAKAAFLTMSSGKDDASKVLAQLPDDSLREMIDVILEGMIAQEIPLGECGKIDNFVRLLAPLPPENTAELVALTVSLATDKQPAKPGKLAICKG
jgi:hypothetical protein